MNIMPVNGLGDISSYYKKAIGSETDQSNGTMFEDFLQSAIGIVQNTNTAVNTASAEEMKYSLGLTDNYHDLYVAMGKANTALSYTTGLKNAVLDAYKEIMNIQF